MNKAIDLIAAERKRQIEVKKWTPEHDDTHECGELAEAAACYALPPVDRNIYAGVGGHSNMIRTLWPWTFDQWKPATGEPYAWVLTDGRIEELVKAGALIVAEIERQQRIKEREGLS